MNVRLTRLSKTADSGFLRNEAVEGYTAKLPVANERFAVWYDDGDRSRVRTTSTVVEVIEVRATESTFRTRSGSLYKVEVL